MVEGIRVSAREEPREEKAGEEPTRKPLPSIFEEALRDSKAVLVSKDEKKNGRFKLGAHLLWGVPVWYAFATLLLLSQHERTLRGLIEQRGPLVALSAVFFMGGLVGPLVVPFATALPMTLGFYALQGRATRQRLRQALVCPYCRDEVEREGTVICARTGCGALYHRECWDECAKQYGGCAVYGCSSKKCREVSAAGWFLRMARLAVAALLFPPRIARAVRQAEGEGFVAIYRRALARTRLVALSAEDAGGTAPYKAWGHIGLAVIFALIANVVLVTNVWPRASRFVETDAGKVVLFFTCVLLPVLLPWILALPATLAFYTFRAVAVAFRSELAALGRADEGGGTVLGRLAAGFGKKAPD